MLKKLIKLIYKIVTLTIDIVVDNVKRCYTKNLRERHFLKHCICLSVQKRKICLQELMKFK
ncbi:MAG: hypothetical protein ACRC0F_05015 [Cetobacterium sp.]